MRGLLFSQMDPPVELDHEFHDWYDTEHVPARLRIPGFGGAIRYEAIGPGTRFLVCYFIDDLAVLDTDEYAQIKRDPGERTERMLTSVRDFTRYTCELVDDTGPAAPTDLTLVHAVRADGPDFDVEDVYKETMGRLDRRTWSRSRLFRPFGNSVGAPWTHLALHEIAPESQGDDVRPAPPVGLRPAGVIEDMWWSYRAFQRFGTPSS